MIGKTFDVLLYAVMGCVAVAWLYAIVYTLSGFLSEVAK